MLKEENEINKIFNCPKKETLVDISDCIICGFFEKRKSKFCKFNNENSCDYYVEDEIMKILLINKK
jgi:hypothetical protein